MRVSATCCVLAALVFGLSPWVVAPVLLVWGVSVIADSGLFSSCVADVVDPRYVGTALTTQTAIGFLLTVVTINAVPWVVDLVGWRAAVLLLADRAGGRCGGHGPARPAAPRARRSTSREHAATGRSPAGVFSTLDERGSARRGWCWSRRPPWLGTVTPHFCAAALSSPRTCWRCSLVSGPHGRVTAASSRHWRCSSVSPFQKARALANGRVTSHFVAAASTLARRAARSASSSGPTGRVIAAPCRQVRCSSVSFFHHPRAAVRADAPSVVRVGGGAHRGGVGAELLDGRDRTRGWPWRSSRRRPRWRRGWCRLRRRSGWCAGGSWAAPWVGATSGGRRFGEVTGPPSRCRLGGGCGETSRSAADRADWRPGPVARTDPQEVSRFPPDRSAAALAAWPS